MTAVTAFSRFFISRAQAEHSPPPLEETWYTKIKKLFRFAFCPRIWRYKRQADIPGPGDVDRSTRPWKLEHQIPRGTMTGVRTFISEHGKTKRPLSLVMHNLVEEDHEDLYPLRYLSTDREEIQALEV